MIRAAGRARFSPATRAEFERALAVVAADDTDAGQGDELGGDPAITLADIAAKVSRQTGKITPHNDLQGDVYQGILKSFGLSAGFAAMLVDVDQKAGEGSLADTSGTLRQLINRVKTAIWLAPPRVGWAPAMS